MVPIQSIGAQAVEQAQAGLQSSMATRETGAPGFGELVGNLVRQVDAAQRNADLSVQMLAEGRPVSLQDVVVKLEEAELMFRFMKEIRDKLLQAYREITSIQS